MCRHSNLKTDLKCFSSFSILEREGGLGQPPTAGRVEGSERAIDDGLDPIKVRKLGMDKDGTGRLGIANDYKPQSNIIAHGDVKSAVPYGAWYAHVALIVVLSMRTYLRTAVSTERNRSQASTLQHIARQLQDTHVVL